MSVAAHPYHSDVSRYSLVEHDYVDADIEYPFEETTGVGDENKIRGNWSASTDYYLSVFGFTFGVGNLWRFPYLCSIYGGVVYFIPYCTMFLLTAIPIVFMELSLGQFISLGAVSVWKVSPLFKGIGVSMLFISAVTAIYFNVITAWALFYLVGSMKFTLPWAKCGNSWNTENCSEWNRGAAEICNSANGSILANGSCVFSTELTTNENDSLSHEPLVMHKRIMPSVEYFHNEVLMLSAGIDDFGMISWQLIICLLVAWIAIFVCSFKGIKTSGRVVYFTVVIPYIILFVLLVRFLTLPGSLDGVLYFFRPQWHAIFDLRVWGWAALQVFYSLSSCTGGLIVLSSYNRFHTNVFRDVWLISAVDFFTSLFVSSLVFSAIGFVCYELDLQLDKFHLQDGVQLVFVFFAEALSKLPVAPLYAMLFFFLLALVIFNSELFIVETIVSSICDEFPERLRRSHRHVLTIVLLVFFVLGIPLCSSSGIYWITLLENFASTWPLVIIAFFEVMVICWIYGADNFLDNVKWMTRYYPPVYVLWKIIWKLVCPLTFLAVLAFVWLEYRPISYDSVRYPLWATALGWLISLSPVFIITVGALYKFFTAKGVLSKRWRTLLCPADDWGPALAIHRAEMYPLQIPEARKLIIPSRYTSASQNGFEQTERHKVDQKNQKNAEQNASKASGISAAERETII